MKNAHPQTSEMSAPYKRNFTATADLWRALFARVDVALDRILARLESIGALRENTQKGAA